MFVPTHVKSSVHYFWIDIFVCISILRVVCQKCQSRVLSIAVNIFLLTHFKSSLCLSYHVILQISNKLIKLLAIYLKYISPTVLKEIVIIICMLKCQWCVICTDSK